MAYRLSQMANRLSQMAYRLSQMANRKWQIANSDSRFAIGPLLLCLLAAATCVFAVPHQNRSAQQSAVLMQAEPNLVSAPVAAEAAPIIKQLCSNIYKGDFAAARALLGGSTKSKSTAISQLINIISEYEAIAEKRRVAREASYAEQLAELSQHQSRTKRVSGFDAELSRSAHAVLVRDGSRRFGAGRAGADANDVNDVNDANDITAVLVVIAKASEFANQKQKNKLLSDPFVKLTFQKAIDKAAEFEAKGKWLDAYIVCYSWLQAIDRENKAYSDYAEQLVAKANIVASFQDSPCESSEERFRGVKKEMFVRAINAMQFNYVNSIDYRRMATYAIKRCELLAEVVNSSCVVRDALCEKDTRYAIRDTQYDRKLAAWSAALAAIRDEIDQLAIGVSKDKFIDIFEKVLALNKTTLELPSGVLIAQFAEAALSALDPYTVMVWPRQRQDFKKAMTNEFTGIGVEISKQKGLLTVASLLLDTPAYNCGLLDAGDVIEAVDAEPTKDMTLTCAVRKITGPAGTKVTLTIKRPGRAARDVTITRARITVPTIRGWQRTEAGHWLYMVDNENKIGYVRIYHSFSERTASDLEKVLSELEAQMANGQSQMANRKSQMVNGKSPSDKRYAISDLRQAISDKQCGLRGLILDLRFNSGGLLDSAIKVTDKFITEGLIVSTRPNPKVGLWTYASAHKDKTHPNYPLIVLINRYSASASEIVAGALADELHNRAILVGERTHGKGSVQGITAYPGAGAQLKYTMAHYHLPSGARVESKDAMKKQGRKDWGVRPNIEIELRSDELKKMLDVQRENDVLYSSFVARPVRSKSSTSNGTNHEPRDTRYEIRDTKHTVEETLAADPQLAVGVLVVRSKLIEQEAKSVKRGSAEL